MAYSKEKKSFHPVRHFRLSQENMDWLEKVKKGTWSNTFNIIRKVYGDATMRKVPGEQLEVPENREPG